MLEFPQIYRNDDGVELIARNDVQGSAFEKQGFKPAGKVTTTERRSRGQ